MLTEDEIPDQLLRKRDQVSKRDAGCFGSRWWEFIGPALMNVILPEEYYQVQPNGKMVFDKLGW